MTQLEVINLENVSENEAKKYSTRRAARAIVFDENNFVALLHATKNNYYKLPGGGIEGEETNEEALKRECLEEIGCNVEVTGEVGCIIEYRKKYKLKQISYCYCAKLVGQKGKPALEQDEIAEGFETVWMPLAEALSKVKGSHPTICAGPYMAPRDLIFLKALKINK